MDGALVFIRSIFPIFWKRFWERDKKMQKEDRGGTCLLFRVYVYSFLVFFSIVPEWVID
jgi:hypothetical protein